MAELKPPETAVVIVEGAEAPLAIETELGDAEIVKLGVGTLVTVRLTVVVWVTLPPVPVMVTVEVPRVAVADAVKVSTELPEPGAAIEDGLKEAVTPAGRPEAERAMAALKPPETAVVIVEVLVLPCTTETEVGAAAELGVRRRVWVVRIAGRRGLWGDAGGDVRRWGCESGGGAMRGRGGGA